MAKSFFPIETTSGSRRVAAMAVALLVWTAPVSAQIDPLLFLKRTQPNVLIVVDTSGRMQRDAPTDPADATTSVNTSSYYDPFLYPRTGALYEGTLIVDGSNTSSKYRRKYTNFGFAAPGFTTSKITIAGDLQSGYASFEAPTRMSIARAALYEAVNANKSVARFGMILMRQAGGSIPGAAGNASPVVSADSAQTGALISTDGVPGVSWKVTRPTVAQNNGAVNTAGYKVSPSAANANTSVLSILAKDVRMSSVNGLLLPAGNDGAGVVDAPVKNMLDDAKTEAATLIGADAACRNTVVVLIVGGGEGTTAGFTNGNLGPKAAEFVNVASGRRVPIYVIAIAPPTSDVASLQAIATNSGGKYFEITKAQIDRSLPSASTYWTADFPPGTVIVPEMVYALHTAVQHAFAEFADVNAGVASEFQVASPIIGSFEIKGAKDISGAALPDTVIHENADPALPVIPQRSNLIVTTSFAMPGFDTKMRAFRVYKPQYDITVPSKYKFVADGTPLWIAGTPPAASRNLYTALPDGTMIAFTTANVAALAPLMNLTVADATLLITEFRNKPLGAVLDSTPAIMNPPSLDPPPDGTYPAFVEANKNRRAIMFVGTNRGVIEAIDARLGQEVWGFIPLNLLPKLAIVRTGQAVGSFNYFVDSSPKIADVKLADGWHTYLIFGEGQGGAFYHTMDVTLAGMSSTVTSDDDDINSVLPFFASPTVIPLKWTYPLMTNFDPTLSNTAMPWGDIKASSSNEEKAMGHAWSDPAVGQVQSNASPYVILIGSGFMPHSAELQANRGGVKAGTTFYMFDAGTGALLGTKDVGNDGLAETGVVADDCVAANDCTKIKNALQSDPVATGPSDSRFISKAYIGDLDGRVWRFDLALDGSNVPIFTGSPTKLYDDTAQHQPIFSSMATVNVGGTQQYIFFGTGSDLLPSNGQAESFKLVGVLDNGATGTVTFNPILLAVDNVGSDEKVTAFPAVAGDIVFFTTTTYKPLTPCVAPDANLYALTFIGGPAYDTDNNGQFNTNDSTKVKTIAGSRATAPFIVDQHLVFGTGSGKVQMFGDPSDFNNGIGQAGVRILSWREVR